MTTSQRLYFNQRIVCFINIRKVLPCGQTGLAVQLEFSIAEPAQVAPPALGAGLSQALVLVLFPPPHVALHGE